MSASETRVDKSWMETELLHANNLIARGNGNVGVAVQCQVLKRVLEEIRELRAFRDAFMAWRKDPKNAKLKEELNKRIAQEEGAT